jgi:hypothetical protein
MSQCQFTVKRVENGKEVLYTCPQEGVAICRTMDVCGEHFAKLKQDNVHRVWYDNGKLNENPDEENDPHIDNSLDNENDTFIPPNSDLQIRCKRMLSGMIKHE